MALGVVGWGGGGGDVGRGEGNVPATSWYMNGKRVMAEGFVQCTTLLGKISSHSGMGILGT